MKHLATWRSSESRNAQKKKKMRAFRLTQRTAILAHAGCRARTVLGKKMMLRHRHWRTVVALPS